jgi:hypothetical protein
MELGGEGEDGTATLLEMWSDVYDEGGADCGESGRIENFERAMRFAVERQLLKAGEEAAFVAKSGSVVVVGMAGFPIGKDDRFRTELADDGG